MAVQNDFRRLAICVLFLIAMPLSVLADVRPQEKKVRLNVAEFGKLPVRFNGRVTTFDAVAPLVLKSVSDREYYIEKAGKKQSAVRWLLDVISNSDNAESHEIVPIQNPELLRFLGFKRVPQSLLGKIIGKKSNPQYVSMAELRPKFVVIEKERDRIRNPARFDSLNDYQKSLFQLDSRI
jgi:hypothetical protein